MKNIIVSDFTLKGSTIDGDRCLTFRDKTDIAKCLNLIGVDVVELPAVNNSKEDAVINRTVASLLKNCTVKVACDLTWESVLKSYDSVKSADNACVRIYVPTSTVQMEYMLHLKAPEMLERLAEISRQAVEKFNNVEIVAQDATRADRTVLSELFKIALENKVSAVVLVDDAGVMLPDEFSSFIAELKAENDIKIFVRTSDALGMAAANAVAAIKGGADGVETSISKGWLNAGVFSDIMSKRAIDIGINTNLDVSVIHSRLDELVNNIAQITEGVKVVSDGTYSHIKLNSQSTMAQVAEAVRELGYELSHEDSGKVYEEFKRVTRKKDHIKFKEIDAIVASVAMQVPSTYHLESYVINSGNVISSTANVVLTRDSKTLSGISVGDGPINAAFSAIEQIIGHHYELDDFQIQAITEGHEAMGAALVKLRSGQTLYSGTGISTDVIGASIRAYINALNKIVYNEQ